MPNISIKEINRTSAGTPGEYGNIAVLIAGYKGTGSDKAIDSDSNGVYEFNSAQAFKDTIGLVENDAHYGNKMAYELLNLGYPVIYKPFTAVSELNNEAFWEIFKDKANYDFRFVSHGLLKTDYNETNYNNFKARLVDADLDFKKFKEIESADEFEALAGETDEETNHMWFASYDAGNGQQLNAYGYDTAIELFTADENNNYKAKTDLEAKLAECGELIPEVFNGINGQIAKLASYRVLDGKVACNGRGDCVALIELAEDSYLKTGVSKPEALIIDSINEMANYIGDEGAYCALTVPSVVYAGNTKMPAAFHYLACFMSSLSSGFAEWYAAAGYTRGVSSKVIDHTSVKLGEIAINALEPRNNDGSKNTPKFACNVIANFRGSYYLWGNRTAYRLGDVKGTDGDLVAHHFLNIRQLCSTIKKQLYISCRRFTFDPNSDTLWYNFTGSIVPTLERMKADQGIRDYKIIKVYTDKKATLKAKIRIIPIEAVEDFDIEISLEDSFGETTVVANG